MTDLRLNAAIGTRVAPLGLRFWDVATRAYVGDGLEVTAFPLGHERLSVQAAANRSAVWVFHHLPGLADVERALAPDATQPSVVDDAFWSDPALGANKDPFVVRVVDKLGRFLPCELTLEAPVKGIFSWPTPISPAPDIALPAGPGGAVPLFSSPARRSPPGMAVVRADLGVPANGGAARAAPWAVLRAAAGMTLLAWGLSDQEGRATLLFPYPAMAVTGGAPSPLPMRSWDITLTAWFTARAPGAEIPKRASLPTVLTQSTSPLWKKWGPAAADKVSLGAVKLRYGEELILRSDNGKGRLWVG